MMKLAMSVAAAGLLRALLRHSGAARDRILLTDFRSTEWRSLTMDGERHELSLRLLGDNPETIAASLLAGLEEADLPIAGHILADIACVRQQAEDQSILVEIEALTIAA